MATRGQAVSRANLEPGDIILYDAGGIGKLVDQQHAGMYIGNGSFVHAAVKGSAVTISKLDDPKWRKAFSRARRILLLTTTRRRWRSRPDSNPHVRALQPPSHPPACSPTQSVAFATAPPPGWVCRTNLGGNTKSGVDRSGFVKAVLTDVYGVDPPRTAEEQETLGQKVDRQDPRTGDLVFLHQGHGSVLQEPARRRVSRWRRVRAGLGQQGREHLALSNRTEQEAARVRAGSRRPRRTNRPRMRQVTPQRRRAVLACCNLFSYDADREAR